MKAKQAQMSKMRSVCVVNKKEGKEAPETPRFRPPPSAAAAPPPPVIGCNKVLVLVDRLHIFSNCSLW